MNDELERLCSEVFMVYVRYYPSICLEGLRKTVSNLSQDSQSPGQESNLETQKYETGVMTTMPLCQVIHVLRKLGFSLLSACLF